ncbi:hypothetical protein [Streptococcus rubneri]|uniref:hypothetical protein n=1 Tax=Streptococcus rubneri TaxID=1234680 RepID=UPI0039C0DFF4
MEEKVYYRIVTTGFINRHYSWLIFSCFQYDVEGRDVTTELAIELLLEEFYY